MRLAALLNNKRATPTMVFVAALALAAAVARPFAGGWNDGSRLATVESLVDQHSLAIDQSVFVTPPPPTAGEAAPYAADDLLSTTFGTGDKLFIDGHYYSDKSPVPALGMGIAYWIAQQTTGLVARDRVDVFCRLLTILTSGMAYAVAVAAMFLLFGEISLSPGMACAVAASFALSTMTLTYAEHVNNHSLFLGVAAVLMLELSRWFRQSSAGNPDRLRLCWIGCLAGAGYAIDLGVGPALIAAVGLLVIYQTRSIGAATVLVGGMMPLVLLHHAVNFAVGGTLGPANANAAYFNWPGCSFNSQNMTGGWHHSSFGNFLLYAASLLFGKRGFIGHNLPLFLMFPGAIYLVRQRVRETPLVAFALLWSALTWGLYAVNSTNSSGQCCSIRWFLPLLAPGFLIVALSLREYPSWRPAFLILSAWGAVLALQMLGPGPWMQHMVPHFWQIEAAAYLSLLGWLVVRSRRERVKILKMSQISSISGEAA
jgi:hypothetical protein